MATSDEPENVSDDLRAVQEVVFAIQNHGGGTLPKEVTAKLPRMHRSLAWDFKDWRKATWFSFHIHSGKSEDPPPDPTPGAYAHRLEQPDENFWYLEMDTTYGEFRLYYIVRDLSGTCWALYANEAEPIICLGQPREISAYDLDVIYTDEKKAYERRTAWILRKLMGYAYARKFRIGK